MSRVHAVNRSDLCAKTIEYCSRLCVVFFSGRSRLLKSKLSDEMRPADQRHLSFNIVGLGRGDSDASTENSKIFFSFLQMPVKPICHKSIMAYFGASLASAVNCNINE